MRAAGGTVQDSDPQGRMTVIVRGTPMFPGRFMRVCVQVQMLRSIVLVLVDMNTTPKGSPQRPKAHRNQYDTDQLFADSGDALQRQEIPQAPSKDSDHSQAQHVTEPPLHAMQPGTPRASNGQRSDRSQVIGPGKNVDATGEKTGKGCGNQGTPRVGTGKLRNHASARETF